MLSYWILRDWNDAPIGLVRVEDDRVLLKTNAASDCAFRLFSKDADISVLPDAEIRFARAEAVLGLNGETPCAFAAAPDAQPMQAYQNRMSRKRTMQIKAETPANPPEPPKETTDPPEPETEETSTFPAVSDTARETEAFAELLRRANEFYARFDRPHSDNVDNLVHKEDNSDEEAPERGIDLFPNSFPGARWRYVEGAHLVGHYEGEYRYPNGERIRILAVRGKCAPCPPRTLAGFTRYLRASDGAGYWLRILPCSD